MVATVVKHLDVVIDFHVTFRINFNGKQPVDLNVLKGASVPPAVIVVPLETGGVCRGCQST